MFSTNIQTVQALFLANPILSTVLVAWTILWKGIALWQSARLSHKRWFIVLLLLNTVGILDIIYLYFVAKKYTVVSEGE